MGSPTRVRRGSASPNERRQDHAAGSGECKVERETGVGGGGGGGWLTSYKAASAARAATQRAKACRPGP